MQNMLSVNCRSCPRASAGRRDHLVRQRCVEAMAMRVAGREAGAAGC